jgi:uncharacterized protein
VTGPDRPDRPDRRPHDPADARQGSPPLVRWAVVALGLALAYLPMYLPGALRSVGFELPIGGSPIAVLVWNWAATALLVAYVLWGERLSLVSILITRPTVKDVEWAFYFWGAAMTYSWVLGLIRPQQGNDGVETIAALPVAAVLALIVTASVTEEILYRGYPIERITELTGRRWIGVLVSAVIFSLSHLPFFGVEWLLYQGVSVVLGYVYYLWRRNLVASMLLHLLVNLPILIPTVLT